MFGKKGIISSKSGTPFTKIYIDLGDALYTTGVVAGKTWNNVTSNSNGVKVADLLDINGQATGIAFEFGNPWFFGSISNGPDQVVGDYPATACKDGMFTGGSTQFSFTAVPAGSYDIRLWGSRDVTSAVSYVAEAQVNGGGYVASGEQKQNISYSNAIVFASVNPVSNEIVIDFRNQSGKDNAFLNVIEITY